MTEDIRHNAFWPCSLHRVLENGACVLVTIISVKGSAPRKPGSRMIITHDAQHGSIGGGNLEFTASETARNMLLDPQGPKHQATIYGLGPLLNQCCGGAVELHYEWLNTKRHGWLDQLIESRSSSGKVLLVSSMDGETTCKWVIRPGGDLPAVLPRDLHESIRSLRANTGQTLADIHIFVSDNNERFLIEEVADQRVHLYLFGAGHVSRALVRVLEQQAIKITWCDQRRDQFPSALPENVVTVNNMDPLTVARNAEPGASFLVMTHSHDLDEDLCHAILGRGEYAWLGLIGSKSKRKRFEHRLAKRGIEAQQLNRLVCPVGLTGITGKRPATIAISIAAQLLSEIVPKQWR